MNSSFLRMNNKFPIMEPKVWVIIATCCAPNLFFQFADDKNHKEMLVIAAVPL